MYRELACVEQMLDENFQLEDIEIYIETCVHLPEDTRSALWLVAWTETNRHKRRRAVVDLMAGIGHDPGAHQPSVARGKKTARSRPRLDLVVRST